MNNNSDQGIVIPYAVWGYYVVLTNLMFMYMIYKRLREFEGED